MNCFYCDSEISENSTFCRYCGMEVTGHFDIKEIKANNNITKKILYYKIRSYNGTMHFWENCLNKNYKDVESLKNLFSTYTGILDIIDVNIHLYILNISHFDKSIFEYKKEMKIAIEILNLFKKMITKNLDKYIKYQNAYINPPVSLNELTKLSNSTLDIIDNCNNLFLICYKNQKHFTIYDSSIKNITKQLHDNCIRFKSMITEIEEQNDTISHDTETQIYEQNDNDFKNMVAEIKAGIEEQNRIHFNNMDTEIEEEESKFEIFVIIGFMFVVVLFLILMLIGFLF